MYKRKTYEDYDYHVPGYGIKLASNDVKKQDHPFEIIDPIVMDYDRELLDNKIISKFYKDIEKIKYVAKNGTEWWHSYKLAELLGYNVKHHYSDKFAKTVITKAILSMIKGGLDPMEHFIDVGYLKYCIDCINYHLEDSKKESKSLDELTFRLPEDSILGNIISSTTDYTDDNKECKQICIGLDPFKQTVQLQSMIPTPNRLGVGILTRNESNLDSQSPPGGTVNSNNYNSISKDNVIEAIDDIKQFLDKYDRKYRGGSSRKHMYLLSRKACYFITMNGDADQKRNVALGQQYFVQSTITLENFKKQIISTDFLKFRANCKAADKLLSSILMKLGFSSMNLAVAKSEFDKFIFGNTTKELKKLLNIPQNKPLVDYFDNKFLLISRYYTYLLIIQGLLQLNPHKMQLNHSKVFDIGKLSSNYTRELIHCLFNKYPEEFLSDRNITKDIEVKYEYTLNDLFIDGECLHNSLSQRYEFFGER